jgi:hypothetical protein
MTTFLQRAKQKGECLMAEREGLISNQKILTTSFFLREKQPEESKGRPDKPTEKRVEKKQVATFSFPNVPLEYAQEEPVEASEAESGMESLQTEKTKRRVEGGSNEENSDEDESEEESSEGEQGESEQENCSPVKPDRPNPVEQSRGSTQDDLLRAKSKTKMNGNGNSQPQDDKPAGLLGRFRRSGSEMKSMKIATEATKDERTVGETVTHCLQVVVAPEIYAEDFQGEGNLGFYRPLLLPTTESKSSTTSNPGPFSGQEHNIQNAMKWKEESTKLRTYVSKLLAHIDKLDVNLKNSNLEAMLWKARAEELQNELKQFRCGDNSDDSSLGCQNCDPESEIDHKCKEEDTAGVKEEILVDTDTAPETIEFDPLSTKTN